MSKYNTREQIGVEGLKNFKAPLIGSIIMFAILIVLLDYQFSIVKPLSAQAETQGDLLKVTYVITEPDIKTDNKDEFITSMNRCITYLYRDLDVEEHLPRELIIAQAILESDYGKSRLAGVSNNLFGIRTWDKTEPHVYPLGVETWPGWGVKAYESKCDSVQDYLRIINEVWAYEELRTVRDTNPQADGLVLADYLFRFSTNPAYADLVKTVIHRDLRT